MKISPPSKTWDKSDRSTLALDCRYLYHHLMNHVTKKHGSMPQKHDYQEKSHMVSICFIVINLERWLKAIPFWFNNYLFLLPLESSVGALNRIRERLLSFDRVKFTLTT
jgi:hypothetical protein